MEVSIKDFFIDLFSSFKYNKENIDEQLGRDFDRLSFYFLDRKLDTKNNFYYLLHKLPYSRLFKRLLWILPTQATLYPFYHFFYKKFNGKIIAEIPHGYNISNDFRIVYRPINKRRIKIEMYKNFRILENKNSNIIELGFIIMEIHFELGNQYDNNIHMKYDITYN